MRVTSEQTRFDNRVDRGTRTYRVVRFSMRSAAVRYCLQIADAIESADRSGGAVEPGVTLWLAAADTVGGAVNVYACSRALAVARRLGIGGAVGAEMAEDELPRARCLVIGDYRLLES